MEHVPSQAQAHLVVAAVRVLGHKLGRPASVEEIADLIGYSKELAGHLVRGLESRGIVHTIKSPFDLRVELGDHVEIENLPREDSGPGLRDEVEEFHERFKKKQEELQNLFDSGELEAKKKQRLAGLEDELKGFKAPRLPNPFGGKPEDAP